MVTEQSEAPAWQEDPSSTRSKLDIAASLFCWTQYS